LRSRYRRECDTSLRLFGGREGKTINLEETDAGKEADGGERLNGAIYVKQGSKLLAEVLRDGATGGRSLIHILSLKKLSERGLKKGREGKKIGGKADKFKHILICP